jgi:hypothetical protein
MSASAEGKRTALFAGANAKGLKVSDDEMRTLNLTHDPFHPEWNYTIAPRQKKSP